MIPVSIHVIVVLAYVLSTHYWENQGFCGFEDEGFCPLISIFAGPLLSASVVFSAIEAIVIEKTLDAAIIGTMLFAMSMPVVIWSSVLCYQLILKKFRSVWPFWWSFVTLYFYGMTLNIMVIFMMEFENM